jgi:opacity protein-like surface antigen
MRFWIVCGLALIGVAEPALAADLPILRGTSGYAPASYQRWGGVYVGGQAGFSNSGADFGSSVSSLTSYILRNSVLEDDVSSWTTLPRSATSGRSFGGFIGYNVQWEDAVLGVELNYNRTSLSHAAADSLARSITNPTGSNPPDGHTYIYDVAVDASASVLLTDFGTLRARAGWAAGPFMPYAFVGLAFGRGDVARSAAITGTRTDSYQVPQVIGTDASGNPIIVMVPASDVAPLVLSSPQSEAQSGAVSYGYAAGVGLDYAVFGNLFVRGEWEWMQFPNVKDIKLNINTFRGAVGLKF